MTFIYRNHELQEIAKRPYGMRWVSRAIAGSTVHLLHQDDRPARILAILRYGRNSDFRVLVMPANVWQISKPRDWEHDLKVIDRSLGLRPGTAHMIRERRTSQPSRYDEPKPPGFSWNQWTKINYYDPNFDYRSHFKKVREEAPEYLWRGIYAFIKQRRHGAWLERNAFDWRRAYPDEVVAQLDDYFHRMSLNHSCMDNLRAAKVGNRQHYHHYHRRKESGCCGRHDEIITLPQGQFHVGFNWGH